MNSFTLHLFPTGTKQGELHLLVPTVMVLVIIIIDRAGFSHECWPKSALHAQEFWFVVLVFVAEGWWEWG